MKDTLIIMPARLESKRIKNKMLLDIGDKTLIQSSVSAVLEVSDLPIAVATDSDEIVYQLIDYNTVHLIKTGEHPDGTSRCIEALESFKEQQKIIIVQADELFIPEGIIEQIEKELETSDIVTVVKPILYDKEIQNPHCVKALVSKQGYLEDMTRSGFIGEVFKEERGYIHEHIGIYGYRRSTLLELQELATPVEVELHKIELLKALRNGLTVKTIEIKDDLLNINTVADYIEARNLNNDE